MNHIEFYPEQGKYFTHKVIVFLTHCSFTVYTLLMNGDLDFLHV